MNDSFFLDSANEPYYSREMQRDEMEENYIISRLPYKNGMIVLMNHPSSITVYRNISIDVLSGSVSVFGYEINPESKPLKVFSSEKTGLIGIKTETYEGIWKTKKHSQDLLNLFKDITEDETKASHLLDQFGNKTVAIFVKRIDYPKNIQLFELYYPHVLEFNLYTPRSRETYYVSKSKGEPIQFGPEQDDLAAKISNFIRSSKVTTTDPPKIVVCGARNTGKSSLIRFLINKILSTYSVGAYHLEADPGQTEFTPAGALSLTKVKEPLIGPAFCHLKKPLSMVFTGSIAPTFPDVYCNSVAKLTQLYNEKYRDEVLFVNTMGWMEGVGLECLENLIKIVQPTLLVEIVTDESSMFDYRKHIPDSKYYQLHCSHDRKNSSISSKEMRELTLLSYLGECSSPFLGPQYLNELQPHSVSWDKIVLHVSHQYVPPNRIIEAMTESMVALCAVDKSFILKSKVAQFPRILADDAENECIGYGFVRAVDETKHLLYIVAPLKKDEWTNVNAVIKGNIMMPDAFILNQEIYETELPYTYERDLDNNDKEKEIADVSMVSLKDISEIESPVPIARASTACYRKNIHKRHRKH